MRTAERKSAKLRAQYHRAQRDTQSPPTPPQPRRSNRRRTAVDRPGGIPITLIYSLPSNHLLRPSITMPHTTPCFFSSDISAPTVAVPSAEQAQAVTAGEPTPPAVSVLSQPKVASNVTSLVPYTASPDTASLDLSEDTDITATALASSSSTPWNQPPTHRWWTTALEDVPARRREFYPKVTVPLKDLQAPDAQLIADQIAALDPKTCGTHNKKGLNNRRKAIDRIHEQAHVMALQNSLDAAAQNKN